MTTVRRNDDGLDMTRYCIWPTPGLKKRQTPFTGTNGTLAATYEPFVRFHWPQRYVLATVLTARSGESSAFKRS
jgi:hypothetical protein